MVFKYSVQTVIKRKQQNLRMLNLFKKQENTFLDKTDNSHIQTFY